MAEYIEREAALEIIKRTSGDYASAFAELRKLPAADVASVVHGRWIDDRDSMICSECGMKWNYCDNDVGDFCYCPNCGSRNGYEVSK